MERKTYRRKTNFDSRLSIGVHRLAQVVQGIQQSIEFRESPMGHKNIEDTTIEIINDLDEWHNELGKIIVQLRSRTGVNKPPVPSRE